MFYIQESGSKRFVGCRIKNGSNQYFFTNKRKNAVALTEKNADLLYEQFGTACPKITARCKIVDGDAGSIRALKIIVGFLIAALIAEVGVWCSTSKEVVDAKTVVVAAPAPSKLEPPKEHAVSLTAQKQMIKAKAISSFQSEKESEHIFKSMIKYADEYGIPYYIACTLIHTESDGVETGHNRSGAIGLLQLMPDNFTTGKISSDDLYDVDLNLKLGLEHYKVCYDWAQTIAPKYMFGYDYYDLAYLIYNVGYGNVFNKYGARTYLLWKKNPIDGTPYKAIDRWSEKRRMCKAIFHLNVVKD